MQIVADFSLSVARVECPACSFSFSTAVSKTVASITAETKFETDLHRVYATSAFRGAAISMCSRCGYAWWLKTFRLLSLDETAEADYGSKDEHLQKFARAYICGKQHKLNHLELGLVALNASWCARDGKTAHSNWSRIAREELEKALRHPSTRKDRGFYQYLLGELCRQESDFKAALKHLDLAVAGQRLPECLITRQTVQARAADPSITLLPPYLVENLFPPVKAFNAA